VSNLFKKTRAPRETIFARFIMFFAPWSRGLSQTRIPER
jgi:hypothetical protein